MNLFNLLFTPHSLSSLSSKMLRATGHARMVILRIMGMVSPNQVLTYAARAAASQLNNFQPLCGRARRALVRARHDGCHALEGL